MSETGSFPTQYSGIKRASERLEDDHVVRRTLIERNALLGDPVDANVHLKMEYLQWMGSFRTRGAYNRAQQGTDRGIDESIVASVGNHTQDVALTATKCGADSTVVMPKNIPQAKADTTHDYGAEVELVGEDSQEAMAYAQSLAEESDAEFVHVYDDCNIVAGQGMLGVEIYRDLLEMDTVVIPIGSGGLTSGIATAVKHHDPEIRVVSMQAEDAETVHESLDKGVPVTPDDTNTIVDGIATGDISELTLRTIEKYVDEVVTVSNGEIVRAVLLLLEHAKQVVEDAGTASVTAVLNDNLDVEGETVIPFFCGDNLDMTMFQTVPVHMLTSRRQTPRLQVRIQDKPDGVARLSRLITGHDANTHDVRYVRVVDALDVGGVHLLFRIKTKGVEHATVVVDMTEDVGYTVNGVSKPSWRPVSQSRPLSQSNPKCFPI